MSFLPVPHRPRRPVLNVCVLLSSQFCFLYPSAPFLVIIGSPWSEYLPAQPMMIDPVAPPRTSVPATPPIRIHHGSFLPRLHLGPTSSWLQLGQPLHCLHHSLLVLYLRLVSPTHGSVGRCLPSGSALVTPPLPQSSNTPTPPRTPHRSSSALPFRTSIVAWSLESRGSTWVST